MQPDHYLVKIVQNKSTLSPGPISVIVQGTCHVLYVQTFNISVIFKILKGVVKKGGGGVVNRILKIKT